MTQTSGSKYAPGYDLFKLIVAVILTIILILLLLRESRQRFAQPNLTVAPPTETERVVLPTMTSQPSPTPTPVITPTEPIPTESIPTQEPAPTQPVPASDPNECPSAPTRIQVGDKVRVVSWLYFRTGPGLNSPIQHTNNPGTEMDVIGGPVCTIKSATDDAKAYLWWYVRMKDGREGWSAEAPLNTPNYLLEPIR
jgi:hypothetical protein